MQDTIFKRNCQEINYCRLFTNNLTKALKLTDLAEAKGAKLIILAGPPAIYPYTIVFRPSDLAKVIKCWFKLTGELLKEFKHD